MDDSGSAGESLDPPRDSDPPASPTVVDPLASPSTGMPVHVLPAASAAGDSTGYDLAVVPARARRATGVPQSLEDTELPQCSESSFDA